MAYDDEYRNTLLDGILEEFKTLNSTLRELANTLEPKEPKEEPQRYQQNYVHPSTYALTSGDHVVLDNRYKAIFIKEEEGGYVLIRDAKGERRYRVPISSVKRAPLHIWDSYE